MATSSLGRLLVSSPVSAALLLPSPGSKGSDEPGDAVWNGVLWLRALGSLSAVMAEEEERATGRGKEQTRQLGKPTGLTGPRGIRSKE